MYVVCALKWMNYLSFCDVENWHLEIWCKKNTNKIMQNISQQKTAQKTQKEFFIFCHYTSSTKKMPEQF